MCIFVVPCEAPQNKAQTTVWIQADGYLARWVQFTLQLYRATKCTNSCMRNLQQTKCIINSKENLTLTLKPDKSLKCATFPGTASWQIFLINFSWSTDSLSTSLCQLLCCEVSLSYSNTLFEVQLNHIRLGSSKCMWVKPLHLLFSVIVFSSIITYDSVFS